MSASIGNDSAGYYPDPPETWNRRETITRLVIGKRGGQGEWSAGALPVDLAETFPKVTHVHLWNLPCTEVPSLPPDLAWLEVRDCRLLESLPTLPASLTCLIIRNCPALTTLTLPEERLPQLEDLDLQGPLPAADGMGLASLLRGHPRLTKVRLEHLSLERWTVFPKSLVDLRLNHCQDLVALPNKCPEGLRRLELEGSRLEMLPEPAACLDYVNLRGMKHLQALPQRWRKRGQGARPRTMFLRRSSLRQPPKSQHGAEKEENVADPTWWYFDDIEDFGPGEVMRAKLLVLGNGSAGKTFFSLAMTPGQDPRRAKTLGSTHGILFWPWDTTGEDPFRCGGNETVDLQLWDFGGQEIYHNAHRLFMEVGAVFAVLWDPDQDGKEAPVCPDAGYQDTWRPLRYWLDFIYQVNPEARVVVVCSKQGNFEAHRESWERHTQGLEDKKLQCHCLPHLSDLEPDEKKWPGLSLEAIEEWLECQEGYGALQDWLRKAVAGLISDEGTVVPSFWEIAQDLVESWWRRPEETKDLVCDYATLDKARFRVMLEEAIQKAIAEKKTHADLMAKGGVPFEEAYEARLGHVLSFLTASGWLYWDRQLADEKIIVDQRRALKAIYTVLDRTPKSVAYTQLLHQRGLFTLEDLTAWGWGDYSEEDRELYLDFMQRMHVCFCLVKSADSWRRQAVYVSPEHLPYDDPEEMPENTLGARVDLQAAFKKMSGNMEGEEVHLSSAMLHRAHWLALIANIGERFGRDGTYARSGCVFRNEEGQVVWIRVRLDRAHVGGRLCVRVSGEGTTERLPSMVAYVRGFVPDVEVVEEGQAVEMASRQAEPSTGASAKNPKRVFVSYAWGTKEKKYSEPVEVIEEALSPYVSKEEVDWLRDTAKIEDRNYIVDELRSMIKSIRPGDCVIVVHSDKYWKSLPCQWEFGRVANACLKEEGKSLNTMILLVEYPDAVPASEPERYEEFWKQLPKTFSKLKEQKGLTESELGFLREMLSEYDKPLTDLANDAKINVKKHFRTLGQVQSGSFPWKENPDELKAWIVERLGLTDGQ